MDENQKAQHADPEYLVAQIPLAEGEGMIEVTPACMLSGTTTTSLIMGNDSMGGLVSRITETLESLDGPEVGERIKGTSLEALIAFINAWITTASPESEFVHAVPITDQELADAFFDGEMPEGILRTVKAEVVEPDLDAAEEVATAAEASLSTSRRVQTGVIRADHELDDEEYSRIHAERFARILDVLSSITDPEEVDEAIAKINADYPDVVAVHRVDRRNMPIPEPAVSDDPDPEEDALRAELVAFWAEPEVDEITEADYNRLVADIEASRKKPFWRRMLGL